MSEFGRFGAQNSEFSDFFGKFHLALYTLSRHHTTRVEACVRHNTIVLSSRDFSSLGIIDLECYGSSRRRLSLLLLSTSSKGHSLAPLTITLTQ